MIIVVEYHGYGSIATTSFIAAFMILVSGINLQLCSFRACCDDYVYGYSQWALLLCFAATIVFVAAILAALINSFTLFLIVAIIIVYLCVRLTTYP